MIRSIAVSVWIFILFVFFFGLYDGTTVVPPEDPFAYLVVTIFCKNWYMIHACIKVNDIMQNVKKGFVY